MTSMVDWINLDDSPSVVVLICLLIFIGGQVSGPDGRSRNLARRVAYCSLLASAVLAISEEPPSAAGDLLSITLRASLAAGIAYGLSLILLPPLTLAWDKAAAAAAAQRIAWSEELARRAQERARREAEEQERRRAPLLERQRRRAEAEARQAARERLARIDDARGELVRFYDEHAAFLATSFPPALFRSKLEINFPAGVSPADSWTAAQTMIAEMLPLIAAGREQRRSEEAAEKKQSEEAEAEARKQRVTDDRKNSIERLAAWRQEEEDKINRLLPEGFDREDALRQLTDRYDELMQQALAELQP